LANPYDTVRYRTDPNPAAHPGRIAAIGRLHGIDCPAVERMRMLEIGCGDGGHLLALAERLPGASFVGFDLARGAIDEARRRAGLANLRNVRLDVADVRSPPADLGRFDVIVAHGLYAWVPDDARAELLAACARHLAPNGLALVSYNTMPGGHLRRMAREILLFHVGAIADPIARLSEARALARFLSRDDDREFPQNAALRAEMREIALRPDQALEHDDLALHHHPAYFHEFVAAAAGHGLQFVAEAEYFTMFDRGFSDATRSVLASMDRVAAEQYRDFLRGRRFRQTLLCHDTCRVLAAPDIQAVGECFVSPSTPQLQRLARGGEHPPVDDPGEFERPEGALLDAVAAALPGDASVAELAGAMAASFGWPDAAERTRALVLDAFRAGRLTLSTLRTPIAGQPSARPRAGGYSRLQATEGERVANARLLSIRLDDPRARALFALLDGHRTREALCREMAARGHSGVDSGWVGACVERFAALGLLEG